MTDEEPSVRQQGRVVREKTVEIDRTVIDAMDLSNLGLMPPVSEAVVALAGEPDRAGDLDATVRVTGTLTLSIEEVSDDAE